MATPQLTTFAIAALKPRAKRYEVSDGACAGLRVSVQPSGTKSFVCRYRHRGKPGTFGRVDTVGLAQARKLAADARLLAAQGRAPWRAAGSWEDTEQRATRKALEFLTRGAEPGGYLYRHYHASGDLLYVGITLTPLKRQASHFKRADWRDMILHIVVEPFATREEAVAAEAEAIRSEYPRFNRAQNGRRPPLQELTA
jgi:hypothetical protein